jgi:hypothetical protein
MYTKCVTLCCDIIKSNLIQYNNANTHLKLRYFYDSMCSEIGLRPTYRFHNMPMLDQHSDDTLRDKISTGT